MSAKAQWEERYASRELPWDTGTPDRHLIETIQDLAVKGAAILEIGCGTGTNAIWLARQGFSVTAIDISDTAIREARKKAGQLRVSLNLQVMDFMKGSPGLKSFSFVFDRGVLHVFDKPRKRSLFAERVSRCLDEEGIWLSIIGSKDAPPRDTGPPMRSALDIVKAVEDYFEILEMKAVRFDTTRAEPPKAWKVVMKKRLQ